MIFLGIDGGGSKTQFLIEDEDGSELASFETGPSNWLSSGEQQSRQSLADGIARLPSAPDVVCGGFAGAGRPEGVAFYRACLESLLPQTRIFVETDAFTTYIGALGIQPGVLLIAGTGSIALARKSDGTMIRAGGWGPLFSDEGGGFWIGREAVATALRAFDEGAFPEFIASIEKALDLRSITEAPSAWKSGALDVRIVASLARAVLEQYPDDPGKQILQKAGEHLQTLMELARKRAELPPSCMRAVSGSVGSHLVLLQLMGAGFVPAAQPPARGAILWARDRIRAQ